MNNILNSEEIKQIKTCGRILKQALDKVESRIRPGVSTYELDQTAELALRSQGAYPAFKNFPGDEAGPFPASLCVSVNDEIVHGIPSKTRILCEGDITSIDLGCYFNGLYTDAARTVPVGKVSEIAQRLVRTTKECLYEGIKEARAGNQIGAIGQRVQSIALEAGFDVVRDLVGHGIGKAVHLEPNIPNFGTRNQGIVISEGMALAIEPMLVAGGRHIKIMPDGWTIKTKDGSLSAHFEHTVVIENGKPVIVT